MSGRPRRPDGPPRACHRPDCGTRLRRKRFNGRLEDRAAFARRRHCSQACKAGCAACLG